MMRTTNLLSTGTAIVLLAATPVAAEPGGILVETQLSDPDPGFVPPRPEHTAARKPHPKEDPTLDEAMENLGRAAGQAAQILQQRAVNQIVEARSANGTPKN